MFEERGKMVTILIILFVVLSVGFFSYKLRKESLSKQEKIRQEQALEDAQRIKELEKEMISAEDKDAILKRGQQESQEKTDHLIEKYAKDSQVLTIGKDCEMKPLVIRFKGSSVLTIENNDSKMHIIAFENQNFFTVSPNDKRELNITDTFNLKEGVLHYRCTDISQQDNVGIMYITQ